MGRSVKFFCQFVCFPPKYEQNQNEKVQKTAFFSNFDQNFSQKKFFLKCLEFHPIDLKWQPKCKKHVFERFTTKFLILSLILKFMFWHPKTWIFWRKKQLFWFNGCYNVGKQTKYIFFCQNWKLQINLMFIHTHTVIITKKLSNICSLKIFLPRKSCLKNHTFWFIFGVTLANFLPLKKILLWIKNAVLTTREIWKEGNKCRDSVYMIFGVLLICNISI